MNPINLMLTLNTSRKVQRSGNIKIKCKAFNTLVNSMRLEQFLESLKTHLLKQFYKHSF